MNSNRVIPISDKPPVFSLPEYDLIDLNNGSQLLMIKDNKQPLINFKVVFQTGGSLETIPGLASLTAQLLTKGTKQRSAEAIAEEVEYFGATIQSAGSWDFTSINLLTLREHFEKLIDVFTDCVLNPNFDDREVSLIKERSIANLIQEKAEPSYLAAQGLNNSLFKGHPYGHQLDGTISSIGTINKENCTKWYHEKVLDSKVFIIVSGDFDPDQIIKTVESKFSVLSCKNENKKISSKFKNSNEIILSNINDTPQATLRMGKHSIEKSNPDFPYFQIVNIIYGGYFLSRLNKILREEKGLTYGIGSMIMSRKYSSVFHIHSSLSRDSIVESIEIINSEIDKISSEKIEEPEHFQAVQYILGSFVRTIETHQQLATMISSMYLNDLPSDFYDNFFNKIAGSKPQDLISAQKKYFSSGGFKVSITGDLSKIEKKISELGEYKIFSPEE